MGSTSKTKNFHVEEFTENKIKYRIVDTIGIGDTKLSKKEVLLRIAEGIRIMKEGIYKVFFTFSGRFTIQEIEAFEQVKNAILESGITKYTTIVRTNFPLFRNKDKCEADRQSLREESKAIAEVLNSFSGIIYVDNPLALGVEDELEITVALNKRKESRRIIMDHLNSSCQLVPYKLYSNS